MSSTYLQPVDYAIFGVPNATANQVAQASVLIDAYLKRPAGLVWKPDGNGNPCYMAAPSPELTLTAQSAITAGASATFNASGPVAMLQIGDCVVLDRETPSISESVQVTGVNGNTLTLGSMSAQSPLGVQFNHSVGCTIETGLLIQERRYLPKQRSTVLLSYPPVARIIGGTGRYAYGRRGDAGAYNVDNYNLLASLNKFGGPPAWEIWPANTAAGLDARTGQVWVPAGVMLVYYSEVVIRYVAGFQYANLPDEIKLACAQVISALQNDVSMGDWRSIKAADTQIERFAASVLSDDVKSMLEPWRARRFA